MTDSEIIFLTETVYSFDFLKPENLNESCKASCISYSHYIS